MNRRAISVSLVAALAGTVVLWLTFRNPKETETAPPSEAPGAQASSSVIPPAATTLPLTSGVVPGMPVHRSVTQTIPPTSPAPLVSPIYSQSLAENDLENVQTMFRDFRTLLKENPVGTNAEIMKSINGGNSVKAKLGPPSGQSLNDQGELVDRWGTPYFFHQLSKDSIEVRSAGPDRQMWTGDDLVLR